MLQKWNDKISLNFTALLYSLIIIVVLLLNNNSFADQSENRSLQTTRNPVQFRPGDAVRILIYPDTNSFLHGTYPIDGDGNVFLPITGKVKITGMNDTQFIEYLKNSYTQYFRIPNIQVQGLIRISILGGFNTPGLFYVDANESLWNAMQRAGGTVEGEDLAKMIWERNNVVIRENLITLIESGKSLRQLGFKSGDQIWVKRPDQPTFFDRAVQIGTLLTATATLLTVYLTFYSR